MKKITFLIYLLLTAFTVTADEIPGFFTGNLQSLFETAKAKKQIAMIDFYTTWCAPCEAMEKTIYRNELFFPYTQKMVSYKIDAEKGEGIALASKYNVGIYPTIIFVDSDGNEIERIIGFDNNLERWFKKIDRILEGKDVASNWVKLYEKDKTLDLSNKLAKYFMNFDIKKAEPFYQNCLLLDPDGKLKETVDNIGSYSLALLSENPEKGEVECLSFISKFSKSEKSGKVLANYSMYLANKDPEKALKVFLSVYVNADSNFHSTYFGYYNMLRKLNGKTSKEDDFEALSYLNKNSAIGAGEFSKTYHKYGELEKAEETIMNWLNNNKNASLFDLNHIGWISFELKIGERKYLDALVSKWESSSQAEQLGYIADTIANLSYDCKEKQLAIKYGELAYKLEPEGTSNKKEFAENLKKYKSDGWFSFFTNIFSLE